MDSLESELDDLFEAIENEDLNKCKLLLSKIKNIDHIHSGLGFGVIHAVSAISSTSFVHSLLHILIKKSVDLDIVSVEGHSALDIAVANNRVKTVKYLLKNGAKPSSRCLELAQEFNNAKCESLIKECLDLQEKGYDTDTLILDLKKLGLDPGPITRSTKPLYLRYREKHALKGGFILSSINKDKKVYSPELELILSKNQDWKYFIIKHSPLENAFAKYFEERKTNQPKSFFTYLLLNSKITQNLPQQNYDSNLLQSFTTFISSIFYIGKGTKSRPYAHLHEAKVSLEKNLRPKNEKTRKITSLWKENFGIICLQMFQNTSSEEAFSREDAMISSIGLDNLTNEIKSTFCSGLSWTGKEKKQFGVCLLYRCFMVYLNEGERPLFSDDIS